MIIYQPINSPYFTSDKQLKVLCHIWHPSIPIACHTGVVVCVIVSGVVEGQSAIHCEHISSYWAHGTCHHGFTEADTRVKCFIQQVTVSVPVDVRSWDASGIALEYHRLKLINGVEHIIGREDNFRDHYW